MSGEERARPISTEDQARLVFTDRDLDLDLDRSSSSVERKEEFPRRAPREEPEDSDFWHRLEETEGEEDTEMVPSITIYTLLYFTLLYFT